MYVSVCVCVCVSVCECVCLCILLQPFFQDPVPFSTAVRYKNSLTVNSHRKPSPDQIVSSWPRSSFRFSVNVLGKPRRTFWPIQC